jgi:hypothetical protein
VERSRRTKRLKIAEVKELMSILNISANNEFRAAAKLAGNKK